MSVKTYKLVLKCSVVDPESGIPFLSALYGTITPDPDPQHCLNVGSLPRTISNIAFLHVFENYGIIKDPVTPLIFLKWSYLEDFPPFN